MSSVDRLFKLADRFARKISLGQNVAGDFQNVLQAAGLWDKSAEVAPMINTAGIPDVASIAINILIDSQFNCKINASATVPIPPLPETPKADATPEDKTAYAEAVKAVKVAQAAQKVATAGAAKLSSLLTVKYGAAMKAALVKAGKAITDTMEVKWLTF